jgi:threonine dehydrogenase-like Zn-dependent dehydrogenase
MGHEFLGVVDQVGSDVATVKRGDLMVASFAWQDNTCDFCREGLQTSCHNGGFWAAGGIGGGQAEAVRVPLADGTLVKLPVAVDSALLPSLLTLSDVFGTGHHAAVRAGAGPRTTVTVIGDGAVGLLAVMAARRLGAERIILMGRHKDRTDLGREFGATDVVAERGDEGIEKVRELTGGDGAHTVLECVGHKPAYEHCHRRSRTRARLHRGTHARHPRRQARAWPRLRPHRRPRPDPRRLPRHGPPRGAQGPRPPLNCEVITGGYLDRR